MKIDLSKIDGEPESYNESFDLGEERLDPDRVTGPMGIRLQGRVRPVGDNYLVSGHLDATGHLSCGRCLEPVEWSAASDFDVEVSLTNAAPMDPELALDEADLDVVYLDGPILDLEDLAIEQVELELPIRVVCTEDCAGLCPTCGANRNVEDACRCSPEVDPRWAALGDLAGGQPAD